MRALAAARRAHVIGIVLCIGTLVFLLGCVKQMEQPCAAGPDTIIIGRNENRHWGHFQESIDSLGKYQVSDSLFGRQLGFVARGIVLEDDSSLLRFVPNPWATFDLDTAIGVFGFEKLFGDIGYCFWMDRRGRFVFDSYLGLDTPGVRNGAVDSSEAAEFFRFIEENQLWCQRNRYLGRQHSFHGDSRVFYLVRGNAQRVIHVDGDFDSAPSALWGLAAAAERLVDRRSEWLR